VNLSAPSATNEALAAWAKTDLARALTPIDRNVVEATEAARSLVLDLFHAASARDLFNACARLGGLMGAAGASPSLAAGAVDEAARALASAGLTIDPNRLLPARSAFLEGYVAAIRDAEHDAAAGLWEYPACAVPLATGEVAIACGFPADDAEAVVAWAGRVATKLARANVRRVILSGPEGVRSEVSAALAVVGIRVAERPSAWSWLPQFGSRR
jgi:hypothetical protein